MISYSAELSLKFHRDNLRKESGTDTGLTSSLTFIVSGKLNPQLFPGTNRTIERASWKEERQGRGHHFDSRQQYSLSWLEDWHHYWSPSQPRQQSLMGHCIIQERHQGDTAKYTGVEGVVHRLMVIVLNMTEYWGNKLAAFQLRGTFHAVRSQSGLKLN